MRLGSEGMRAACPERHRTQFAAPGVHAAALWMISLRRTLLRWRCAFSPEHTHVRRYVPSGLWPVRQARRPSYFPADAFSGRVSRMGAPRVHAAALPVISLGHASWVGVERTRQRTPTRGGTSPRGGRTRARPRSRASKPKRLAHPIAVDSPAKTPVPVPVEVRNGVSRVGVRWVSGKA